MKDLKTLDPKDASSRSNCEVKGGCVLYKDTSKFPDYFGRGARYTRMRIIQHLHFTRRTVKDLGGPVNFFRHRSCCLVKFSAEVHTLSNHTKAKMSNK